MLKSTMTMPGVLCALLGLLLIPSSGLARSHAANGLVVGQGQTYTLQSNESWPCVNVGGVLYTNGHVLTITDANGLKIAGSLIVDGGCVTIEGGGDCGIGIDGALCLLTSDATLNIEADTTFTGSGRIVGKNNAARIDISANRTFVSHVTVQGRMQVNAGASGEFHNRHEVIADQSGGTLEFTSSTVVDDDSSAVFKAINGGKLLFSRSTQQLAGDFMLDNNCGILEVGDGVNVVTCGDLTFDSGLITVGASGATFEYVGYAGSCTNPGGGGSGTSCSDRFVVSSSANCGCP